jgi:predicted Zn-dependent protease
VARARGTVRQDFVGIPPNGAELYDQIMAHGWPAARAMIDDTAAKWPDSNLPREVTLARTGARLLQAHRTQDAVAVLAEIARRFPDSANAWNSLAEVYEGAHQLDDARRANARGLAALAGDSALTGPRRDAIERALNERAARLTAR